MVLIVVNLKTYEKGTGLKALELAKSAERVARDTGADIIIAAQAADIYRLSSAVSIPIYAQHIDAVGMGAHTGSITAEAVAAAGAGGTLLNHAEKRIPDRLEESVRVAMAHGLKVIVCAATPEEAEEIAGLGPDYVAVEPPELIGGSISVSSAKPEVVSEAVSMVKKVNSKVGVLVGAGVKTGDDVHRAVQLGADGVLLASGVLKAESPEVVLRDLAG